MHTILESSRCGVYSDTDSRSNADKGGIDQVHDRPRQRPISILAGLPRRQLTIATWNIAGARTVRSDRHFDYGAQDKEYFARELRRVQPDVVCLQESHLSDTGASVAVDLAQELEMPHVCETPLHPSHIDSTQTLSIAILSRWPLQGHACRLPDPRFPIHINDRVVEPLPRSLLIATLPELPFTVATVHANPDAYLGFDYENGIGRSHGSDLACAFDAELPADALLAGDLNMDSPSTVLTPFAARRQLRCALPDAPTVPAWGTRPDHILYPPRMRVHETGIECTDRADHYLSWARIGAA